MNKQPRSVGPLWRIKDGYWAGVAAASPPATELRMFLGEYTAAEFLITTVRNREQYNALIGPMEFWGDRMAHKPWTARI